MYLLCNIGATAAKIDMQSNRIVRISFDFCEV